MSPSARTARTAYVVNDAPEPPVQGTIDVIDVATSTLDDHDQHRRSRSDGIAITPGRFHACSPTNGGDGVHPGSVSVVSTATNTVTSTIPNVGVGPFHIKVSPDGTQAWLLNWNGGERRGHRCRVEVRRQHASQLTGGGPWNLAFTPNGKQVWVDHRRRRLELHGHDGGVRCGVGAVESCGEPRVGR